MKTGIGTHQNRSQSSGAWPFARRDATASIALTQAMSLFDLGRGRGGVDQALRRIRQPLGVVGVGSDRLFPLEPLGAILRDRLDA